MPEVSLVSNLYIVAVIGALLSPAVWSLVFGLLALHTKESERTAHWTMYIRRMRVLNLLAVPAWWSLSGAFSECVAKRNSTLDLPEWVFLVAPLCLGIAVARFVTCAFDGEIVGRRWTVTDLFRLSFWSTVSTTLPLLTLAGGIDAVYERNMVGVLWVGCAGILALIGKMRLRTAEGLNPRVVKSGELFRRSFAMAKRTGVRLRRVFVVPVGRGRLLNAWGGGGSITMTDVCIHWLHGAQLDFVIGHELAHIQQKHGWRNLRIAGAVYAGIAALTLAVPHLPFIWRVFFKFGVILIPLLVFYSVSRRFEFAADRTALEFTGEGEIAIRALATLYFRSGVPANCNNFDEMFMTHPSLWRRIDAIARVGQVPIECVTSFRKQFNERADDFNLPHGPE